MTTVVVDTTSSLLGHVTCFISTRTSCMNSRVSVIVPLTRSPIPAATPVMGLLPESSFFTFTACVAITSFTSPESDSSLPVPLISTPRAGVPACARRALISGRGGGIRTPIPGFGDRSPNRWTTPLYPEPAKRDEGLARTLLRFSLGFPPGDQSQFLHPAPTLDLLLQFPGCFTASATFAPD